MFQLGKRAVKAEGDGEGMVQPLEEERSRKTAWLGTKDLKMAVTWGRTKNLKMVVERGGGSELREVGD